MEKIHQNYIKELQTGNTIYSMRIVKIMGGLGNQMWQYAMLVSLREQHPEEQVYYDASFFNGYSLHNGFELNRIFNITSNQAPLKCIRKVYHHFVGHYFFAKLYRHCFPVLKTEVREVEVSSYNEALLKQKGDYYYDGYWADHRYYDVCKSILRKEFSLKNGLDEKNERLLSQMRNCTTCSIHVRRGDYLKDPDFAGICDEDYYKRAIKYAKEKKDDISLFLIFSNDINWCREHLSCLFGSSQVAYVDWNKGDDSYKDMVLMSHCDVNIIANSSFSWWAAYLNDGVNPLVISPKKYKNVEMNFDIFLDNWVRI